MSDNPKPKSFPEISSKLSAAPNKKSLFERQKAEAEAKRAREKAETAAVYEDFVKSFDDDNNNERGGGPTQSRLGSRGYGSSPSGGFGGGPSRRHFTGSGMRGIGGPPQSMSRKRTYEGSHTHTHHRERDHSRGLFSFENPSPGPAAAFQTSDDEEEKNADKKEAERAAAKPTLHLSSLPPGTSPAAIKALIPPVLVVDSVKIIPPNPSQSSSEKRIWSAIVTLAKETAATDMDTVVSSLQNKYLGWGYSLSISRHLSSAAINSTIPITSGLASLTSQPFGARPTNQSTTGQLSRAPPPGPHRGRFAPPSSYGPSAGGRGEPSLQVNVKPPSDLRQIKLIHKTLENLLTYGPEFEALLMSRPEVQKDEKWAWIWDARSTGGVWYRWKLWDILTNTGKHDKKGGRPHLKPATVFEAGPSWAPPDKNLQFEYTTAINEFVSDEEYDSSDEDDSDREDDRHLNDLPGDDNLNEGTGHLNPLQKAKLVHLLARLPTTTAKLRKGDIARVTAFAISHAGQGPDEVVDLIVSNVITPFAFTNANPERLNSENEARGGKPEGLEGANENEAPTQEAQSTKPSNKEVLDTSSSKLVGLYVISDILSSSSTSGVRHAWRYRQLFENALNAYKTFEHLGRLEKELGWGRLKIEKWRRSIGNLLSLWEGWCVFPQSSQEHFVEIFERPPLTEKEQQEEKERSEAAKAASVFGNKGKSRWKAVDEDASATPPFRAGVDGSQIQDRMDIDGAHLSNDENVDGEPMDMDDIDGVPMEDSDLEEEEDGEPLIEDSPSNGEHHAPEPAEETEAGKSKDENPPEPQKQLPQRRRRPKAEDMFADSDSN